MQSEFDNFQPFVPANEAWEKLKPSLDLEQKKRRGIIWWWFTNLAIVVAIGTGVYLYNRQEKILAINNINTKELRANDENIKANTKKIETKNNEQQQSLNQSVKKSNNKLNNSLDKRLILNNQKNIGVENLNSAKLIKEKTRKISNGSRTIKVNNIVVASKKDAIIPNTIDKQDVVKAENKKLNTNSEIVKTNTEILKNKNEKQENTNEFLNNITSKETNLTPSPKPQTIDNEKQETRNEKVNKQEIVKQKRTKKEINESKSWQYGLQWNIPFTKNVNFLNINRTNNPAIVFIPSLYVKKPFGNRSSVEFYVNPYATHYINNKTVMQQNSYNVTIAQGSRIVYNTYTETNAANKIISTEMGLFYGYNLNKQLMLRAGLSYNWSNWAMVNTTVLRNGTDVMLDTLFSLNKGSNMWQAINPTFMLGKFDILYSFKKLEVGVNFTTPLKPLTNLPNDNTPANTNLFMRWRLR